MQRYICIVTYQLVCFETQIQRIIGQFKIDTSKLDYHEFKHSSFAIPTNCDYCKSSIWGTSKKGLQCVLCKYNCHTKCELRVAQNCTKTKGTKNTSVNQKIVDSNTLQAKMASFTRNSSSSSINRSQSINSKHMDVIHSNKSEITRRQTTKTKEIPRKTSSTKSVAPTVRSSKPKNVPLLKNATVLYDYSAQDETELTIKENEIIKVFENNNDGSGWVKATKNNKIGIVPANYIQINEIAKPTNTPNIIYKVRALYDYSPQNEEDIEIKEGQIIDITNNVCEGWLEGIYNGRKGQFPENYVEKI